MAQRTRGEGTIYKRKDGRYEAAAYFRTTTGSRKRVRFYGTTRKEAHHKLTAAMAKAHNGVPAPDKAWTVGDYLDYWLNNIVMPSRRPKTYQQYESVTRLYLKPGLGTRKLSSLSVPAVQTFLNEQAALLTQKGQSIRTAHVMRAVLSAALTRAQKEELVIRNVAHHVELSTHEPADVEPWTQSEAQQFIEAALKSEHCVIYLLLLVYGLRRGEVLGLRWCDIDPQRGLLHVRQQLQPIGGVLHQGPVKTRAGRRDLPLVGAVARVMAEHWQQTVSTKEEANEKALIFTTRTGAPINPDSFSRTFRGFCRANDIRPIKLHHLRHTTATLLKRLGVPARDAQLILGHSQITVTQQIYQHDDMGTRKENMALIDNLLLSSRTSIGRQNSRHSELAFNWKDDETKTTTLRWLPLLGAGRGIRTPEDVCRLIYSSLQANGLQRAAAVRVHAGRWASQWVLGAAAVSFSRHAVTTGAA